MPGSALGIGPAHADNRQTRLKPGINSRCLSVIAMTFLPVKNFKTPRVPVGASLLAKRECQPTLMSPDPALSRAGSLPQVLPGLRTLEAVALRHLIAVGIHQTDRRL